MFIWRIITAVGVHAGMTFTQLMNYTYVNALLAHITIVNTFINDWDSAGKVIPLFTRPMSVYGQVISRTVKEWVPTLLLFTLPMAVIAPFFGIQGCMDCAANRKYNYQHYHRCRPVVLRVPYGVLRACAMRGNIELGKVQRRIYCYIPVVWYAAVYEGAAVDHFSGGTYCLASYVDYSW